MLASTPSFSKTPQMSPESRLILARVLMKEAVGFANQAQSTGNIKMLRQSRRFARKASSLIASVLSNIITDHADKLTGRAESSDNAKILAEALKYSKDAAALAASLVPGDQDLDNSELVQSAFDSASSLRFVLSRIQSVAQQIIKTNKNPEAIEIAEKIFKEIEAAKNLNEKTIKLAYNAGAIPSPPEAYEFTDEWTPLPFRKPSWPPISPASPV